MGSEGSKVPSDQILKGRDERPFMVSSKHAVNSNSIFPPFPENTESIIFGMGCFWGAERRFWEQEGVIVTAAGYAGGGTPNPTYDETCTGKTNHAEVVKVVFDPAKTSVDNLLQVFWESHDPTTPNRQGNDRGTVYRSVLYHEDKHAEAVEASREAYQNELSRNGKGSIVTEIEPTPTFYYAEDYHQQYLHKNPNGYCGLRGTGVSCPRPRKTKTKTEL